MCQLLLIFTFLVFASEYVHIIEPYVLMSKENYDETFNKGSFPIIICGSTAPFWFASWLSNKIYNLLTSYYERSFYVESLLESSWYLHVIMSIVNILCMI